MKFSLLDHVIEQTGDRIVAVKQVSLAEEYLADHFPSFPVLPGVMMIEAMAQAARALLAPRGDARLVLGSVRALKFGSMVRPGEALRVEVTLLKETADNGAGGTREYHLKGVGAVLRPNRDGDAPGETAVAGRFTMRAIRVHQAATAQP